MGIMNLVRTIPEWKVTDVLVAECTADEAVNEAVHDFIHTSGMQPYKRIEIFWKTEVVGHIIDQQPQLSVDNKTLLNAWGQCLNIILEAQLRSL